MPINLIYIYPNMIYLYLEAYTNVDNIFSKNGMLLMALTAEDAYEACCP